MLFGVNNCYSILSTFLLGAICLAVTACGQSNELKLEQSRQHQERSNELRLQNNLEAAIAEQQKAVSMTPNDSQAQSVLGSLYKQMAREKSKSEYLPKAKESLEKAIKLEPNDSVAHSMLADVLSQTGDEQGAVREQKEAVRLNPKDLNDLTTLGVWQHNANDVSAARKTYEEVLKINPNYIYALLRYGLLENEAGNVDNAKRLFIRATDAPRTEQLDESFAKRAKAELQKMDGEIK